VILAQMGAFVPARKAHVGVVDRVLTRVGASDNLSRGESTFMVEMKETAHVLRQVFKEEVPLNTTGEPPWRARCTAPVRALPGSTGRPARSVVPR